jgi:hypothetical protein
MSAVAISPGENHGVVQGQRVAQSPERQIARALAERAEERQWRRHDRELLEPGVLEAGEDIEARSSDCSPIASTSRMICV